jgi:hypothetical protein
LSASFTGLPPDEPTNRRPVNGPDNVTTQKQNLSLFAENRIAYGNIVMH